MICLHCQTEIQPPKRKFCCRDHKNVYNNKHLYKNKYTQSYRSKTPENFIRSLLVRKDRKETLTLEMMMDLFNKQNGLCAISGVEMTHVLQGGRCPSNISIDRIDSAKGYEPSNVQLVCALVNTMKMQYTKDDLIGWCQKIVEHNK